MSWGFRAQRRADDFDSLVGRSSTGGLDDAATPQDSELLELVGALRSIPDPQPRPEFVADLRNRLMAEAETALRPTDVSRLQLPARRTTRERRIAAIVGGLAVVGATTSVALASQSALPGESLYPIKRVIESAHTGLSLGQVDKGTAQLANASSRLDEVTALAQDPGPGDDERIASTLATFTDEATAGADLLFADYADSGREASIVELRDFASSSMEQLAALEPQIPYAARDELVAAASILAQIGAEAVQQCPTCGGAPIASIPPSLVSAEQVSVPPAPVTQQAQQSTNGRGTKTGNAGSGGTEDAEPALPDLTGAVPPGSVLDPGATTGATTGPTTPKNPLRDLTHGLTGVLTGTDPTAGTTNPGSSPSAAPLDQPVEGVTGILEGVLDPITGQLLPSPTRPGGLPTP